MRRTSPPQRYIMRAHVSGFAFCLFASAQHSIPSSSGRAGFSVWHGAGAGAFQLISACVSWWFARGNVRRTRVATDLVRAAVAHCFCHSMAFTSWRFACVLCVVSSFRRWCVAAKPQNRLAKKTHTCASDTTQQHRDEIPFLMCARTSQTQLRGRHWHKRTRTSRWVEFATQCTNTVCDEIKCT